MFNHKSYLTVTCICSFMMLSGCATNSMPSINDSTWNTLQLMDKNIPEDSKSFIIFNNKKIMGYAGCNNIMGSYAIDGGKISIKAASTMMMCQNMDVENKFLDALNKANKYQLVDDDLILYDSNNKAIAKFIYDGKPKK